MEHWQILLIVAAFLHLCFVRKVWGILDPLFLFLVMRIATAVTVAVQYLFDPRLEGPGTIHLALCIAAFLGALWMATPRARAASSRSHEPSALNAEFLLRLGLILLAFKIMVMASVFSSLPIISGESGSDSYIAFDESHKIASTFLLGIGSADTVILGCAVPLLVSRRRKVTGAIACAISILLAVASLKKSALVGVLFSLALAEYLRGYFFGAHRRVFLRPAVILPGLAAGVAWIFYIYQATIRDSRAEQVVFENLNAVLNFAPFQFLFVYILYVTGAIYDFAATYDVNRALYFFHSFLSPLGLPAFAASIGPALHQYQTGSLSGNGVNPTFVVEGYILFGKYLGVFYAAGMGALLGFGRWFLLRPSSEPGRKVLLCALFLPPLYVLPVDSLLAIKQCCVGTVILCLLFLWRSFKRCLAVICAAERGALAAPGEGVAQ